MSASKVSITGMNAAQPRGVTHWFIPVGCKCLAEDYELAQNKQADDYTAARLHAVESKDRNVLGRDSWNML